MKPFDLTGAVPDLFVTRTRGNIGWATVEREWPPEHWPFVLNGLRPMLVGCVLFANSNKHVSGAIARFSLS